MGFKEEKRQAINNLAASVRAGDVDEGVGPVIEAVNSLPDYYTTSSCGGRVVLMQDIGGKGQNSFIGKWHGRVTVADIDGALKPCDGVLWFRFECPIIHIMARDVQAAGRLMHQAREAGFKRTGIQSVKEGRVLVEVLSTERVDAPVMDGGRRMVTNEYLAFLVCQANEKYEVGAGKLRRLQGLVRELRE